MSHFTHHISYTVFIQLVHARSIRKTQVGNRKSVGGHMGENQKAERKQCLHDFIRLCVHLNKYGMSNIYVDPWDMSHNFCFLVYAQKSLFIGENPHSVL